MWEINDVIKKLYDEKVANNPYYSIRAFARQAGINDSTLAKIIRKKRVVGPKLVKVLEQNLGISLTQHLAPPKTRTLFKNMNLEKKSSPFPVYFMGLLEHLKIKPNSTVEELVSDLKVSRDELVACLLQFVEEGWVKENGGRYELVIKKGSAYIHPPFTNEDTRNLQKRLLKSSLESVDANSLSERSHMACFFRFSESELPRLRDAMDRFLSEVSHLSNEKADQAKNVYCIQLGTFPFFENLQRTNEKREVT